LTYEEIIVVAVRAIGALPVLRWAFMGAIIAIVVDLSDLFIISNVYLGGVRNYQNLDKALDLIYMLTFFVVVLKWSGGWEKRIGIALFAYRMLGLLIFELTSYRIVLFIFPNVFETWFLFVTAKKLLRPHTFLNLKNAIAWLQLTIIIKLVQEYILHWGKLLDRYKMGDVWSIVKDIINYF
jgi:hypothetical protein